MILLQGWDRIHLCSVLWGAFSLLHINLCEEDKGSKNNGGERALGKETMCHAVLKMSPDLVTLTGLLASIRTPHSI